MKIIRIICLFLTENLYFSDLIICQKPENQCTIDLNTPKTTI